MCEGGGSGPGVMGATGRGSNPAISPTTIGGVSPVTGAPSISPMSGGYIPGMSSVAPTGKGDLPGVTGPNAANAALGISSSDSGLVGPGSHPEAINAAFLPGSLNRGNAMTTSPRGLGLSTLDFSGINSPSPSTGGMSIAGGYNPANVPNIVGMGQNVSNQPTVSEALKNALNLASSMPSLSPIIAPIAFMAQFAQGTPNEAFGTGVSGAEGSPGVGGGPSGMTAPSPAVPAAPPAPQPEPEVVFRNGAYYNRFTGKPVSPEDFFKTLSMSKGY